jgi:ABC-type oligopeptide transport system ATPase subunit
MHCGQVVEQAQTADLFTNPKHAESQSLLATLPIVQTGIELVSAT